MSSRPEAMMVPAADGGNRPQVGRTVDRWGGFAPAHETSGAGRVDLCRVGDRTVVTRLRAMSPLKLLVPRQRQQSAWVVSSSFGGGLVEGDHLRLTVRVGPGATGYLGTQATTKVYRCAERRGVTQDMHVTIADEGLLVVAPGPVTCFAGAVYDQCQRFALSRSGSLVLIDWVTAGRMANGEIWSLKRYQCRNEIDLDGDPIYGDAMILDDNFGPAGSLFRTGPYHCLATVVFAGVQVEAVGRRILSRIDAMAVEQRAPLLLSASAFEHGVIIRVAGVRTADVESLLHEWLGDVVDRLGDDPWSRHC